MILKAISIFHKMTIFILFMKIIKLFEHILSRFVSFDVSIKAAKLHLYISR